MCLLELLISSLRWLNEGEGETKDIAAGNVSILIQWEPHQKSCLESMMASRKNKQRSLQAMGYVFVADRAAIVVIQLRLVREDKRGKVVEKKGATFISNSTTYLLIGAGKFVK